MLITSLRRGQSEKLKKGGGNMVQGQIFLKGGEKLLYPSQNRVMPLKKNIFFCHHNCMELGHSKLSRNEPEDIP